ncbi:bifunctional DNA primase/polymerase [Gordonia amicalis]|uniref:bifunctional DNA primase/polymerase n=1 Tax=Gordonia amicalis TaxID=89053 RepID=UPI0022A6D93F|nr:bifunctional DNA primase/polymerase [Gordonia amicalis]MCZ0914110.1 bifunctional DNA primase/polymerase [Gordonia amicalis]
MLLGEDLDAAFDDDDDEIDYDDDTSEPASFDTSTGYGAAAPAYWKSGWRAILPLPRGRKFPPPSGYTGDGAAVPSYADITALGEDHPTGNLALVMPDGVIGIDVDDYPGKRGGETLAKAESAWGALPPTVRSTSRDDGVSGILCFRVSPGRRWKSQLDLGGTSDVEIIQRSHRYSVVWPSIHPTGNRYRWLNDEGVEVGIPSVADLPMLPDRWAKELTAASVPSTAGVTVDVAEVLRAVPDGDMDQVVAARLDEAMTDLRGGGSRHDTTTRHVLALLRFAEQGHPGVRSALTALCEAFVEAVTADGSRSKASALGEFKRMLTNERGHALIAASPTLDFDELDEVAGVARGVVVDGAPPPTGPPATASGFDDDEFWSSCESLSYIRKSAYGRMVGPWGVLGAAIARALCLVPPHGALPALIGGRGSLNHFVALTAPSGAGKGASEAVANELVPHGPEIGNIEAGSGEGLAHQFVRRATASEIKQEECDAHGMIWLRRACLIGVSEVDTLTALGNRSSSTLLSKMRSGWSGEELGFGYATAEKALHTGKHTYRLAMTIGVQPERASGLLGDSSGGTPQRISWFSVLDPRVRRLPHGPVLIEPLKLPTDWPDEPWTISVPDAAASAVLDAHVARQRGEGDALDGHALFARVKVMVALAVLDGRMEPNQGDWERSGVVMAHSDATRASVVETLKAVDREAAAEKGERSGVEREAAVRTEYDTKLNRVCGVILRAVGRLTEAGKPATEGAINRLIAGRDRAMKPDALEALILHGDLIRDKASGEFRLPKEAAA